SGNCVLCHRSLQHDPAITGRISRTGRPEQGFAAAVTGFSTDHPEFRIMLEGRKDPTPIKLNDAKHLRPALPGASGSRVQMQCIDCHRFTGTDSKAAPMPIEFERDCQSCHSLQFDEHIPEAAPHEEPVIVNAFIRTALSKYAGVHRDEWKTVVDWHP